MLALYNLCKDYLSTNENLKNIYRVALTSLLAMLSPVVCMLILAKFLDADLFIKASSLYYLCLFFVPIVLLQEQSLVLRNASDKTSNLFVIKAIFRHFLLFPIGIALCVILYFCLKEIVFTNLSAAEVFFCIFAALAIAIGQSWVNYLNRKSNFRGMLNYSLFVAVLAITIVVIYSIFYPNKLVRLFAVVSSLPVILFMTRRFYLNKYIYFFRYLKANTLTKFREIFAEPYGFKLIPQALALFILGHFDKVVVLSQLDVLDARSYVILAQIISVALLIPVIINKLLVPWVFENSKLESRAKVVRLTLAALLCMCLQIPMIAITIWICVFLDLSIQVVPYNLALYLAGSCIVHSTYLIFVTLLHDQRKSGAISTTTVGLALGYTAWFLLMPVDFKTAHVIAGSILIVNILKLITTLLIIGRAKT
jgi:hypothetical protein